MLPDEVLSFVMPSRFCLPDELGHEAWQRFGDLAPGWGRVQAIVDYVHGQLEFVPGASNPWTTAADAYRAGQGVCRDFAHLAITFCRALNIPARYVFGYIPDIGVAAARRGDGLRGLVRGLSRRPLAHLRCSQQHAPHRARGRRTRPRRRRRRADHLVRAAHADRLRGARHVEARRNTRGPRQNTELRGLPPAASRHPAETASPRSPRRRCSQRRVSTTTGISRSVFCW